MFKRRLAKSNSFLLRGSNRGSDITKPNSTSLIANQGSEIDELPKELTGILSEYIDNDINKRQSTSIMNSFSQKLQSTPKDEGVESGEADAIEEEISQKCNESKRTFNKSLSNMSLMNSKKIKLSYFNELIASCGAVQLPGNASYLLSEDQALFSMKVNEKLQQEDEKNKFLKSFEEEISNMDTFRKMLAHTKTSDDCQVARGPVQDPLMRLLLNADCLQVDILDILMGKLANIIMDSDSGIDDNNIIPAVIRQIRFLNRVKGSSITSKLFEIIEIAPVGIQREIIFSLPEIVSEEEHEEATKKLLELLKLNSLLTHVIIDALTNLSLNDHLRSQVRTKILNRLDKCPIEFLPLLVQFIITRCNTNELPQVIESLRMDLPFTLHHHELRKEEKFQSQRGKGKKFQDDGSYVKLTFENLKFSVMTSKQMADIWIKIITNIKSSIEFRCVDLVMLIIMYSSVYGRKNQILSLFRTKIKSLIVTEAHIQQTFKILLVILVEYSSSVMELASVFLKSFEPTVSDFAAVLYEASFVNFNFYLRQNVVSEILVHIGTGTNSCINSALLVLSRLSKNQPKALSDHTVSVMSLLMKLPDLEPIHVRSLMDVIATLIYANLDENSALQDELQMFIRKQISSSKIDQHKKGVVAAIMYAKQAAADRSGCNLNEINSLLEIAFGPNTRCDGRRAFFNDELATLLREVKLNENFIEIWEQRSYKFALDNLFLRNLDLECEYFPMSLQFALETDDDKKFVFPAVDFVKRAFEENSTNCLLTVAPSILRLLWCSEKNFEKIMPFLSASVIMPDQSVYENFETLAATHQKLILDCLFLCSNYFIECINALCTQKTSERVLIRIKQLMEIRKFITKHITAVPNYTPPTCQYYAPVQKPVLKKRTSDSNKPKRGRKRKLDDEGTKQCDQPVNDVSDQPSSSKSCSVEIVGHAAATTCPETNLQAFKGYFREIHFHAFKLLGMDLKLNPTKVFKKTKLSDAMINEEAWYYKATEKPELDSTDLLFLLEEYIYKSDQILKDKKYMGLHKGKTSNSAIEHISTEVFIAKSAKILPKICSKIETLASYCKDLIAMNDNVYDAPGMFPKDSTEIKLSLAAALKVVAELISWHGFRSSNNKLYLKDVLSAVAKKGGSTQETSINSLGVDVASYLSGFAESNLLISGALSIVKAVQSCLDYCTVVSSSRKCSLAKLSYDLLLRPWFTVTGAPERGAVFNQQVDFLMKTYFSVVENKLQVVRSMTEITLDECEQLTGKESTMETFKTINKSNFPLLYRSLCEALVSGASAKLDETKDDHEVSLNVWSDIVQILLMLVDIVKMHSTRVNLAALLKRSQAVIQLFLSKGIPVMESALRINSTLVLKLLKSLQIVTRFLHSVCCHSKLTSDATVAAHVPAIRSLCERITLEVKGMLILNKIPLDCITIATLKNKDLRGNDIISQETNEGESEDESELPPEEGSENEESDKDVSTQESNSEVY